MQEQNHTDTTKKIFLVAKVAKDTLRIVENNFKKYEDERDIMASNMLILKSEVESARKYNALLATCIIIGGALLVII